MSITGNSNNIFVNNANLKIVEAGRGLIFSDGSALYSADPVNGSNVLSNIYEFTNAHTAFVISNVTANTGFAGNTAPTDAISVSSNLFISYTGNLITFGQITAGSVANVESNILNLETSNGLVWSNISEISDLQTSNGLAWSNIFENQTAISNLQTSNGLVWSNIFENQTAISDLQTSNKLVWSNIL